jgi:hypothetical protein
MRRELSSLLSVATENRNVCGLMWLLWCCRTPYVVAYKSLVTYKAQSKIPGGKNSKYPTFNPSSSTSTIFNVT